jgi:glycerol-3-phosphate dehydrogenase
VGHGPERAPLEGRHFDVAVVGGGINGVAIARECARAGRRTLLVELNDFASGTTSRSTRIIHGGLRYLEHGEIGLVRESLRERQRLCAERPHLVRPLEFVLALPRGRRSALELRLGLWLYRKLGGAKAKLPADGPAFETALEQQRDSLHLFHYEDAQCEFPERLAAEWLRDAMRAGAVVRNHTAALRLRISAGRARGVLLRDQLTGAEYEVGATRVVNATGPWADAFCLNSQIRTAKPLIGGVHGGGGRTAGIFHPLERPDTLRHHRGRRQRQP